MLETGQRVRQDRREPSGSSPSACDVSCSPERVGRWSGRSTVIYSASPGRILAVDRLTLQPCLPSRTRHLGTGSLNADGERPGEEEFLGARHYSTHNAPRCLRAAARSTWNWACGLTCSFGAENSWAISMFVATRRRRRREGGAGTQAGGS